MSESHRAVQSAAAKSAQTRVRNAHQEAATGTARTVVVFQQSGFG